MSELGEGRRRKETGKFSLDSSSLYSPASELPGLGRGPEITLSLGWCMNAPEIHVPQRNLIPQVPLVGTSLCGSWRSLRRLSAGRSFPH